VPESHGGSFHGPGAFPSRPTGTPSTYALDSCLHSKGGMTACQQVGRFGRGHFPHPHRFEFEGRSGARAGKGR